MWLTLLQNIALGGLLAMLGHRLGKAFLPNESKGLATVIGTLATVALLSIAGTVVYYGTSMTTTTLIIAGAIVGIGVLFITKRGDIAHLRNIEDLTPEGNKHLITAPIIVAVSLAAWWTAVLLHPITDAVRSPWLMISPIVIIAPAIALMMSFLAIRWNKSIGSILLCATLFSMFASASFIFPLGNGFDPFLHRATIAHIAEHGTITPKPLYYIGEYALELFANLIGGLAIFSIDVLLVPIIAAITLTIVARKLPIGAAILLIALANFTTTTPQSLGYLWLLLAIVTIDKAQLSIKRFIIPTIFAVAAFVAHPIAGVPALLYITLSMTHKTWLRWTVAVISAVSLPTMFVLQAFMNNAPIIITPLNLWRLDQLPLGSFFMSNGNVWLDLLYLIIGNLSLIIFILAVVGAIANRNKYSAIEKNSGLIAVSLIVSFILVSLGIDFSYLISYERQDFALRFLTLASLFALPLASAGMNYIDDKLIRRYSVTSLQCVTIFIVSCASIYALYPRHDGYARSAAFNVSQADINTVYAIHNRETDNSDYIVLANQATSSAALQEFGFRKYYHGNIFYYPIPTGGPLYQSFLSMVENQPSINTIKTAMKTAGVHKAYFVVSDYWWKSYSIIDTAKTLTDDWFAVDGGKTTVFIFTD